MPRIAYVNSPFGDPEVHAPGCADIKKKVRQGFDLAGYAEVTTQREAFLDYNADFIDDGYTEEDFWQLKFFPCTGL